eukprot:3830529-Rhodomonas_salina.1
MHEENVGRVECRRHGEHLPQTGLPGKLRVRVPPSEHQTRPCTDAQGGHGDDFLVPQPHVVE